MTDARDEAVVLRTYKLGESDRICVLMTKELGKVRAVAKGVRKTSSRLGARMEVLDCVDVLLARGRGDLRTVRQVESSGTTASIRGDYDRLGAGMVIVEAADAATLEDNPDPAYFEMVRRAIASLGTACDPSVVATAFLLKTLAHDGAAPILDACASCGADGPLVAFDLTEGGLLCRTCRRGRPVSDAAVALLRRILLGGLAQVLTEPRPAGADEVATVAIDALEAHLGRRLRAARALDAG